MLGTRNRGLFHGYGRIMHGRDTGQYVSGIPTTAAHRLLDALFRGERIEVHLMHKHKSGTYDPAVEDTKALKPAPAPDDIVEGVVSEVLEGFGLAHVQTADGRMYGLNRLTAGIEFSKLHEGARVRCQVTRKFNRVLHAELLG